MHQQARSRLECVGRQSKNISFIAQWLTVFSVVARLLQNASDSAIDRADESDVDEERCESDLNCHLCVFLERNHG